MTCTGGQAGYYYISCVRCIRYIRYIRYLRYRLLVDIFKPALLANPTPDPEMTHLLEMGAGALHSLAVNNDMNRIMIDQAGCPTVELAAFHGISPDELRKGKKRANGPKAQKKTLEGLRLGVLRFDEALKQDPNEGKGVSKKGKKDGLKPENTLKVDKYTSLPEVTARVYRK